MGARPPDSLFGQDCPDRRAPVTLTLLVQPDGYLSAVDAHDAQQVDVSIALAGDTVAAFLQGGQAAVMKHVKIEGDAEFATQIAKLAEHLRWEPEEDLAKLVGDAAAYRIATVVRDARRARAAPAATCSIPSPNTGSTRTRKSSGRASLGGFDAELARARDALARVESGSSDSNKNRRAHGFRPRGAH